MYLLLANLAHLAQSSPPPCQILLCPLERQTGLGMTKYLPEIDYFELSLDHFLEIQKRRGHVAFLLITTLKTMANTEPSSHRRHLLSCFELMLFDTDSLYNPITSSNLSSSFNSLPAKVTRNKSQSFLLLGLH